MKGWVTVMSPNDYQAWLQNGVPDESMADQGHKLFDRYGCVTCHVTDEPEHAPSLTNVFGHPVQLEDGRTVIADEAFLRESILNPSAKVVKGYQPNIMPVFEGQINEEGLLQLIVYIKSLSDSNAAPVALRNNPAGAILPAQAVQKQ
jgi:cytochrome c oxidase subunit 2